MAGLNRVSSRSDADVDYSPGFAHPAVDVTAGTGFTINSSSGSDTSVVTYVILP